MTTTQHLQDGNKDESLKDSELVDLDTRRPEGETGGGEGSTEAQALAHEVSITAPVTVDGVCGGRMRCTGEWLTVAEQQLIELKDDMFGDDLQEQWKVCMPSNRT